MFLNVFFFKLKPKTHTRGGCSLVKLTVNIFLDKYSQNKNFLHQMFNPLQLKRYQTRQGQENLQIICYFTDKKRRKKGFPFCRHQVFLQSGANNVYSVYWEHTRYFLGRKSTDHPLGSHIIVLRNEYDKILKFSEIVSLCQFCH